MIVEYNLNRISEGKPPSMKMVRRALRHSQIKKEPKHILYFVSHFLQVEISSQTQSSILRPPRPCDSDVRCWCLIFASMFMVELQSVTQRLCRNDEFLDEWIIIGCSPKHSSFLKSQSTLFHHYHSPYSHQHQHLIHHPSSLHLPLLFPSLTILETTF